MKFSVIFVILFFLPQAWGIENFHVEGPNTVSDYLTTHGHQAILFIARDDNCPLSKKLKRKISKISKIAESKNIKVVEVFFEKPNETHLINENVIVDLSGIIQENLKFRTTTEVILIGRGPQIVYRGAIDDQFQLMGTLEAPNQKYLISAIESYISDKPIKAVLTEAPGCVLTSKRNASVKTEWDYYKDIKPLVKNKCQICHANGDAHIPLDTHENLLRYKSMIHYVVKNNLMPPWYADTSLRRYKNDFSMAESEKDKLLNWIEGGAPKGSQKVFSDKSSQDSPVKKGSFEEAKSKSNSLFVRIPIKKAIRKSVGREYLTGRFKLNNKSELWVKSYNFVLRPRKHFHHVIIYAGVKDDSSGAYMDELEKVAQNPYLHLGTNPSMVFHNFIPENHGYLIPANAVLYYQVHVESYGIDVKGIELGINLELYKKKPNFQILTTLLNNENIEIKPNSYGKTEMEWNISKSTNIISVRPHMHLSGQKSRIVNKRTGEILYRDSGYYPFLANTYFFENPTSLAKGDSLILEHYFDNTKDNLRNPFYKKVKKFGPWIQDEMASFNILHAKRVE